MTTFKPRLLAAVAVKRNDSEPANPAGDRDPVKPIGERDTVKTTVELPGELWRAAKIRAMDERSDLRSVLIRALQEYLGTATGADAGTRTGSEDR